MPHTPDRICYGSSEARKRSCRSEGRSCLVRLPIELMNAQNHLTSLLVRTYSTSPVRHPAEQNSCCFGHLETFTRGVVLTPPQNVQD